MEQSWPAHAQTASGWAAHANHVRNEAHQNAQASPFAFQKQSCADAPDEHASAPPVESAVQFVEHCDDTPSVQ